MTAIIPCIKELFNPNVGITSQKSSYTYTKANRDLSKQVPSFKLCSQQL